MASWEDMKEYDPFWKHEAERAKEAMNDKEIGILGQVEAAKDYEKISKKIEK